MSEALFHGLLVVDKPTGMTSRDVVDHAKRWFPRRTRLGHTGTLDPLATGVLVLTVGAATRLTEYVQRMDKTYRTTIRLGATSDSDDADGNITAKVVEQPPDRIAVERALQPLVGAIDQVPPAYSAVKVQGQRAYAAARRGVEIELKPRRVSVYSIDILAYDYPTLELDIHCGKGTYIRSLARDLGARLGSGGYVEVLRRTRVGPFAASAAIGMKADRETARGRLLPMAQAVSELPRVIAGTADQARLQRGQAIALSERTGTGEVAVFDNAGQLVAVCQADGIKGLVAPAKVFASSETGQDKTS